MSRRLTSTLTVLALHLAVLGAPAEGEAQGRADRERASMELSFDHGVGVGTVGPQLELAADLRLWAPFGLGGMVRLGGNVTDRLTGELAVDVGVGYRFDLVSTNHLGLRLVGMVGGRITRGTRPGSPSTGGLGPGIPLGGSGFDSVDATSYGAIGMVHLDFWHRSVFFGVGVTGQVLQVDEAQPGEIGSGLDLRIIPTLRVGGSWSL